MGAMSDPPIPPAAGDDWRPMVALRHLRDGRPDHVDWLLARDADGTAPLWSFRCAVSPVAFDAGALGMRATADHRPRYLAYEGPVSGDRGTVERIGAGRHRVRAGAGLSLELAWDDAHPTFVIIGTKSPSGPHVPPPPAEQAGETVHWLIAGATAPPDAG